MRPYSESCDQNRDPILIVLKQEITTQHGTLLEIGSGTGQHSVYFAPEFPHILWQPSELEQNMAGILMWMRDFHSDNIQTPIPLDTLNPGHWPKTNYDLAYSANTTHIMSWQAVCAMFEGVSTCLHPGGKLILYGPFNYDGNYTSESNARFDQWLKQRDPASGIRDLGDLKNLAAKHHMELVKDYEMPVNNRILVWQRI